MKRRCPWQLTVWATAITLAFVSTARAGGTDLTANLVQDGGIEQWEEIQPTDSGWNTLAFSWKSWQFAASDKGGLWRPAFLNQPADYQFKGILKKDDGDVHGGKHALRLKGGFYLNGKDGEAVSYKTAAGDVFVSRYWVKGEGQVRMHLTVYGEGQSVLLEQKGKPQKDAWTLIEERCLILGQAPTQINPWLWSADEMLVDDIFVGRVLRAKEISGLVKAVPDDAGARVVFVSPAIAPPVLDGRLDDACWQKATPYSGFRNYNDQITLAGLQTLCRVLRDETTLYFGFEIQLPNARQILAELTGNAEPKPADSYRERHSVELFLQPSGSPAYYQFVVSLDGCRYDGMRSDATWNGTWTFAISADEDRWFLEMQIPTNDMSRERIASGEEWRLNIVRNKEMGYSTWSVVGGNFHNPAGFGTMLMADFADWHGAKVGEWASVRKNLLAGNDPVLEERLRRLEAYEKGLPLPAVGGMADWETLTRCYGGLAFVDESYRTMQEEKRYRQLLPPPH